MINRFKFDTNENISLMLKGTYYGVRINTFVMFNSTYKYNFNFNFKIKCIVFSE